MNIGSQNFTRLWPNPLELGSVMLLMYPIESYSLPSLVTVENLAAVVDQTARAQGVTKFWERPMV